jgi:hypothetical protein
MVNYKLKGRNIHMNKSKIEGVPLDLNILLKGAETIPKLLNTIKEDPEIIKALNKSEQQKFDVLSSIAGNETLPEEERVKAVHKIFETIDIGNQINKDVNERENNNNDTRKTVLITVGIIGLSVFTYKFYGSIPTYEEFIKIASIPQKMGKNISKLLG